MDDNTNCDANQAINILYGAEANENSRAEQIPLHLHALYFKSVNIKAAIRGRVASVDSTHEFPFLLSTW